MSTDATQMGVPGAVSLEPDWLRSKPVFSRFRYGQEELLNLWTSVPACPQSILDIPELGAAEPLKPAYLAQYTEEQDFRHSSSRGRVSERGRGGRGGAAGRGGGGGGSRGPYNSRFGGSSSSSDNWRRRDPEPEEDQPPSYPPYPAKGGYSPTDIDDRETNSWKRTNSESEGGRGELSPLHSPLSMPPSQPQPQQQPPPLASPTPVAASPLSTSLAASLSSSLGPPLRSPLGGAADDSPEAMLRSISQSVYDTGEPFDTKFTTFHDTHLTEGANLFSSPASLPSQIPSSGESLFSSRPVESSSAVPQQPQSHFPSLAEIGTSLSMERGSILRGQGFMPPAVSKPPPPPSFSTPPPTAAVSPPEMWFYLDPKGNTQGPFDSKKMFSWFLEGYFGMDLFIRRASEEQFTKLELLIHQCGGKIPFQTEDKSPSPPRPTAATTTAASSDWTAITSSIWGDSSQSRPFGGISGPFLDEKAKRAEEMRQEIERAMAQKRKMEEEKMKENQTESFLLAQRQLMEAKLAEEAKVEEELARLREEEAKQKRLIEEEAERIRLEKEQLEQERQRQSEQVRMELEEAERARQALAQERLNLERERQMVKQKEEELLQRQEMERKKLEEARQAQERAAAQKAAEEAKAIARAQEEAARAKREAERRAAEERKQQESAWSAPAPAAPSPTTPSWSSPPAAAAPQQSSWPTETKTESPSGWGSKPLQWGSPPQQENTNPWANIPKANTTRAAAPTTRGPPTSRGWSKPEVGSGPLPLSQIQQDEVKRKANAPSKPEPTPSAPRGPLTWGAAPKPGNTRSLADIQREEQKRSSQQQNYNYVQQTSWNPVAGMLEDDQSPAPKPKAKPQQPKGQPKQKAQPKGQAKGQQQKKAAAPPPPPVLEILTEPKDEFTQWCETQVASFKNPHIDVPTFISFLRDVESPRDVREYVVSYLGDTLSTDKFIQEFVAKRKNAAQRDEGAATISMTAGSGKKKPAQQQQQQQASSKKGKKKKMQKVNAASLLGINCTASSDTRNRGDIDYVLG